MTTLSQKYPVGSFVKIDGGLATVLDHDERAAQLKILGDDIAQWVGIEEVLVASEVPDLTDPEAIEEFLNAVDIRYDVPPAAQSVPCTCPCPPGSCYRVSSNGFHMTNGDCRCKEQNCACL